MFLGLYRLGVGAGIEELLSRIYKGFLRYFVQGLQGFSSKVSKVLSPGLPRYFIEGFPQGLIKDFQGVISWNFRRALSKMSEASRMFIQVFRFPRCLGFSKYYYI